MNLRAASILVLLFASASLPQGNLSQRVPQFRVWAVDYFKIRGSRRPRGTNEGRGTSANRQNPKNRKPIIRL